MRGGNEIAQALQHALQRAVLGREFGQALLEFAGGGLDAPGIADAALEHGPALANLLINCS